MGGQAVERHAAEVALVSRLPAVPTILKVITESTGLRLSLVAHVTHDAWIACAVRDSMDFGLHAGDELDVATTLCSRVRDTQAPVVIDHVSTDAVYCGHPTPRMYGFESYISVPIFLADGSYFGTLCGLDAEPRKVSESKTVETFQLFARLVGLQIDADEAHERTRRALAHERDAARHREQFVAMIGHDLRNPVESMVYGIEALQRDVLPATAQSVVARMKRSVGRMHNLLDGLADLARGRLGRGIAVDFSLVKDLSAAVEHAVDELGTAHPERTVRFHPSIVEPISVDRGRVQQMISNLVANALEHGAADQPVDISIVDRADSVELRVANRGTVIPAQVRETLFDPFVRASTRAESKGLGLGLYIVDQIVRAHGGSVRVESTDADTAFVCVLPRAVPA